MIEVVRCKQRQKDGYSHEYYVSYYVHPEEARFRHVQFRPGLSHPDISHASLDSICVLTSG